MNEPDMVSRTLYLMDAFGWTLMGDKSEVMELQNIVFQ